VPLATMLMHICEKASAQVHLRSIELPRTNGVRAPSCDPEYTASPSIDPWPTACQIHAT
jgi:hypothetical protein